MENLHAGMSRTGESQHTEGPVARRIEEQTAKLPSDTFLWAALGAITASATMQAMGQKHGSLFVGQWAPVFLMLGIYNKLVKQLGSDQFSRQGSY
ncbi:MAG TPA: hypothetical protein VF198_18105 [Vicinamibacterales bacterium]